MKKMIISTSLFLLILGLTSYSFAAPQKALLDMVGTWNVIVNWTAVGEQSYNGTLNNNFTIINQSGDLFIGNASAVLTSDSILSVFNNGVVFGGSIFGDTVHISIEMPQGEYFVMHGRFIPSTQNVDGYVDVSISGATAAATFTMVKMAVP